MTTQILVVDDDPQVRELFCALLSHDGYVTVEASDGVEALARLRELDVDVVVLDLAMPRMSGLEVMRALRAEALSVEVVVATAQPDSDVVIRCLREGAVDVLPKPAKAAELRAAVALALERQRERVTRGVCQICQAVFATEETARLPEVIVRVATEVMSADDASLLLPGEDGNLYVAHASGMSAEMQAAVCVALGERVAGRVAADRTPALLRHGLGDDPRFDGLESFERVKSSIVYPMVAGDRLAGILNINRVRAQVPFCRADLHRASVLASLALLALENSRLTRHTIAADRLATLGTLAASLSHEINNPLMYVFANMAHVTEAVAWVENLVAHVEDGASPEALRSWLEQVGGKAFLDGLREAAHDASQGVERIRDIARDMRNVARSDQGERTRVDLSDAVRSALRLASMELSSRATVETSLERGAFVLGSAGALSQVHLNLLINAAQAIHASKKPGCTVLVTTRREGERVVGEVRDTGPGIAPNHLARLFEPFFTTKGSTTGTGLGLWISREIVRRHGGDLVVESTLGEGTTFRMTFPACPDVAPGLVERASGARPDPAAAWPRLLFVDDEIATLRAYERHFAARFEVASAEDGARALALLSQGKRFDAVICDLLMPVMNGMELYESLESTAPDVATRFLFVTGSVHHPDVEVFLRSRRVTVLEKPLVLSRLERVIEERLAAVPPH